MPADAAVDFESLSVEESSARLAGALARLDEERFRPSVKPTRTGQARTDRTKKRLSDALFQRRRAETLLAGPTKVARLRLAAGLTMRRAADKALVNERTWHRAESDFDGVSPITQRRIAHALGVAPDALR
jgi:anti-sigma factor RsiW